MKKTLFSTLHNRVIIQINIQLCQYFRLNIILNAEINVKYNVQKKLYDWVKK